MINDINKNDRTTNEDDAIQLGTIIGHLIDHKKLILSSMAIFALIGGLYSWVATPIYKADALIQVEQNTGNSILTNLSSILPDNQPASAPEIELLKSRMVLGGAVEELNLDIEVKPKYFPIIGRLYNKLTDNQIPNLPILSFNVPSKYYGDEFELEALSTKEYELSLDGNKLFTAKVGERKEVNGISIYVSDTILTQGNSYTIKKIAEITAISNLLEQLNISEKGKDTGIISLSINGADSTKIRNILSVISRIYLSQNIERKSAEAAKSLDFLDKQLPEIRTALDESENKLNLYRQQKDSVDLSLEAKSVLDTVVQLDSQLNELTFREAEISKLYTKEHPSYKALLEKRRTLEDEKKRLSGKITALPQTQQQILKLTRDVQVNQEIYMQLLNKKQELSISKASTVGNIRIIDSAVTNPEPIAPQSILIILMMTIFGAVVSVIYIIIHTILHKGIQSAEQLEEAGMNVYASVPLSEMQYDKTNKNGRIKAKRGILSEDNPADITVEAIRSLRTSLHFATMEAINNIIMISGPNPGIGKSFISANLAAVIAQANLRVLLIDADMRRGELHKDFSIEMKYGLSDLLANSVEYDKAIIKNKIANLDFLPRGQVPPNPSELLMRKQFSDLLGWASSNYDLVIIDTPPVFAVTDPVIIGKHAGTSFLVALFEGNTVKEVDAAKRRFDNNGININGIILNGVVKRATNKYGNYAYYQYSYNSDKK
ncbi:polysaccharide biosynthesis tyrosine autokinase [Klebsiella oxytoca]|uniref:Polysaccharide biosynthesis tyrosine autokinase n=1 Tax=Klebsiella oxytoca TaxID=571 RepID=A0A6B8MZY9_KLEOX|nr:polysaccharide biosynthesis tyrosine autokinase [Klebsiella oxytoca]QGN38818.1 polysaccharide biosynthesis tyrosine autokinase [Klebsiella oxytoca]